MYSSGISTISKAPTDSMVVVEAETENVRSVSSDGVGCLIENLSNHGDPLIFPVNKSMRTKMLLVTSTMTSNSCIGLSKDNI